MRCYYQSFVLRCILLLTVVLFHHSDAASVSETMSTSGALEGTQSLLIIDLLKRVKLLEERAGLVEAIGLNQQEEFESLHRLIERQQMILGRVNDEAPENSKTGNKSAEVTPSSPLHVAFTAYLNHDIVSPPNHQPIVFNKVILNDGNGYNQQTGIFYAPTDGVYNIFFSVGQRDANKQAYAKLFVNDENIMAVVVETLHTSQDLQGSNRAILRLDTGDSVRVIPDGAQHIEGSDSLRITSFSGYLIY